MSRFCNANIYLLLAVLMFGSMSATSLHAQTAKIRHDALAIYPAQNIAKPDAALTLDGSVDEWNPLAFVLMFGDPLMREFYNVRLALAYDDQGLWIAARYVDTSPLQNPVNPIVDPFRGWDGDALQIRIITDATLKHPIARNLLDTPVIKHLTMWQYTPETMPTLDIRHGMKFKNPITLTSDQAPLKFHQHADGQGYDLEAHIPWALLKVTEKPVANQQWLLTVQPLWSDEEGMKKQHSFFDVIRDAGFHFQRPDGWGHGRFIAPADTQQTLTRQRDNETKLDQPLTKTADHTPHIPIHYHNPAKGYVSLAICKPDGQIVRTLLAKQMREQGDITDTWDGLDDDGQPAAVGDYILKALVHDGITPRFVTSVHNSGDPSWLTSDGKGQWGADHGNPVAAAAGPDGWSYIAWGFNEEGHFLQGVDPQGKKQWGASVSWGDFPGQVSAIAYHDNIIYVAKDGASKKGGGLMAYDAKTGKRLPFVNNQGTLQITQWDNTVRQAFVKAYGQNIYPFDHPRTGAQYFGSASLGSNISGMAAGIDHLYVSMLYENKIVKVNLKTAAIDGEIEVKQPGGLAFDHDTKRLYAISENKIVAIKSSASLSIEQTIVANGLDNPVALALDAHHSLYVSVQGKQMQVRVFDMKGKLLRTIGKEGGRPWQGKYDTQGMLMPTGICVTNDGKLWVTENNASPKRTSVWDAVNGAFVREYFGGSSYAVMMAPDPQNPEQVYLHDSRFVVDYETGKVTPDATMYNRALADGPSVPGTNQGYGFMGNTFQISRVNDKAFAFNGYGGVFEVQPDHFKPLLYIGGPKDRKAPVFDVLDIEKKRGNTSVVWIDQNNDAIVQDNETRLIEDFSLRNNIVSFGGAFHPGATFISGRRIFKPDGLTSSGAPNYPKPEDAPLVLLGNGAMDQIDNWRDVWPSYETSDATGWREWYAIAAHNRAARGKADFVRQGVYRFDRQGNIRWAYRRVVVGFGLEAPLSRTGDIYGALRIAGLIQQPQKQGGEIVGIGSYRGYFSFLNEDGLFIDQVGHDMGRGPRPNFDTFFIENFSGYFFKHPRTQKIYLFAGDTDARILELQGWNSLQTFQGKRVNVTHEQYDLAVAAKAIEVTGTSENHTLHVAKVDDTFDGNLKSLPAKNIATVELIDEEKAHLALAYDTQFLHVVAEVTDASPAMNASMDWRFAFKAGDAVDVQLGVVNPNQKTKRQPQPGDVRIFIVPQANSDQCQLIAMWKRVPQGMEKQPMLYQSPTGQETFERVALLDSGSVKLHRNKQGYTIHAMIPWKTMGMKSPDNDLVFQGDIGVLLSDAQGSITTLRKYLFNKDTGIVRDIPNEVRVQSQQWGLIQFE